MCDRRCQKIGIFEHNASSSDPAGSRSRLDIGGAANEQINSEPLHLSLHKGVAAAERAGGSGSPMGQSKQHREAKQGARGRKEEEEKAEEEEKTQKGRKEKGKKMMTMTNWTKRNEWMKKKS